MVAGRSVLGAGRRRAGSRLGVAVGCAAALILSPSASATGRAGGSQPTRATGRMVWVGIYEETGDDWNETWGQGSEAVITVRMEREGSEWVDAGSSFRARYLSRRAPYCEDPFCLTDCTIVVDELFWLNVARFDAQDPTTGFFPSSISLAIDFDARSARLDPRMSGGPMAGTIGLEGGDCQGDSGTTVLPWSPDFEVGAYPWCPIGAGGVRGTINDAGTRIDFGCHDERRGETPNGEAVYVEQVRVDGYLRLTQ